MQQFAVPKSQFERRSTLILVQYWNQLRGERELPREEDIDPDRLIGVWERCFLVQVRDINAVKHFNYSYFGSDLISAYKDGRLEESNGHIASPNANLLEECYREVLEQGGLVMQENEYKDVAGNLVRFRQIMMPFGKADGTIEAIFGGAWFRLD